MTGGIGGPHGDRVDGWPEQAPDGEPEWLVLDDQEACAAEAARRIARILAEAVSARGRADWATTGGSTPAGIYRHLARPPLRDSVPWAMVDIWLGDERFVPRTDDWCNARIGDRDLVAAGAGTSLASVRIHAWPVDAALAGSHDASWAAEEYIEEMRAAGVPFINGQPVLDIVLVGIGPDGHLLSVFPGSEAFDTDAPALAIPAPAHVAPKVERVTLNPRVLDVARHVIAVAHGASKAAILGQIFGPVRDPRQLPAQLARRAGATWIVDRPAATGVALEPAPAG